MSKSTPKLLNKIIVERFKEIAAIESYQNTWSADSAWVDALKVHYSWDANFVANITPAILNEAIS